MAGRGLSVEDQLLNKANVGGFESSRAVTIKRLALRYAAERLERAGEHGTSDCVRLLRQMADDQ